MDDFKISMDDCIKLYDALEIAYKDLDYKLWYIRNVHGSYRDEQKHEFAIDVLSDLIGDLYDHINY